MIGLIEVVVVDDGIKIFFSLRRRGILDGFLLRRQVALAIANRAVYQILGLWGQPCRGAVLLLQAGIFRLEELEMTGERLFVVDEGVD